MTETKCINLISEESVDLSETYPYNMILDIYHLNKDDLDSYSAKLIKLEMEKALTEREEKVLEFRYKDKLTLKDTGKKFDISGERVRHIQAKATRKLANSNHRRNMMVVPYIEFQALQDEIYNLKEEINKLKVRLNDSNIYDNENSLLNTNIFDIELSSRTYNCLVRGSKIETVKDMANFVNNDFENFMRIRNLGRKTLKEIVTFLDDHKLLTNNEARVYLH